MCGYLIKIPGQSAHPAVYRCEHGLFHLTWENTHLSLTSEDLSALRVMSAQIANGAQVSRSQKVQMYVRKAASGISFVDLWLEKSGVRLMMAELKILERAVAETLAWLERQPQFSSDEHIRQSYIGLFMERQIQAPVIFHN